MTTSEESFEEGFIRIDLFIRLITLGFMLLWMMVEYVFRLLVKCQKRQVVSKVRANDMAIKLVASSIVILDRYQHRFLVSTENKDNKTTQIFYPCNSIEVKLYGFSKSLRCLVSIIRISGLEYVPVGEGFTLQEMSQEMKLGGSKCVVVSIHKTAADFVFKIGQHVDKSVLRSQHYLVQDDIGTPFFTL